MGEMHCNICALAGKFESDLVSKAGSCAGNEHTFSNHLSQRHSQTYFVNSAWLAAKTCLCSELPFASMVTTAGKCTTSNSQIASGAPNLSKKCTLSTR